jgi:hypothetical protein
MEEFYMFTIGKSVNTKNSKEFERYCKIEGLSSLYLRREVYNINSKKRKSFFKSILALVTSVLRHS